LLLISASGGSAFAQSPDNVRAAFLKLIDRPRVDPAPAMRPMTANGLRLVQEHISFAVELSSRVTGILIKGFGSTGRLPVVIQLHGTGGSKESMLPRLMTLANRGFIAVAIDGRYHGERAGNAPGLQTPYTTARVGESKSRGVGESGRVGESRSPGVEESGESKWRER
jgi:hypothetical protein